MNHDDNLFLAMCWVKNKPSDDMKSLVDTDRVRIDTHQFSKWVKFPLTI